MGARCADRENAFMRIVWNSFHGRFSDNPRALWEKVAESRHLEHIWLADAAHLASFPSGVLTVDINGPHARQALESADVVVANTHTEVQWVKPSETIYVQTWHGTPLKRIHRDVLWAPEGRLDRLDSDVAKWDVLLSPNRFSTPRLRSAFRYEGEVLESGYPRNDLLSMPQAEQVRTEVRRKLGIAEGSLVVLYTPTWRDDEAFDPDRPDVTYPLDSVEFSDRLGPGYVLLVRSHNMVTGRARVDPAPGVHDVSLYPDLRELYCAADVLVTDYSSAMFDFAITGRPIIHFAHDLEHFGSAVRGFYVDLESIAAGPIVTTMAQLVEALRDLVGLERAWAERYADFRETFTSLEDGHARDRVLDRLGLDQDRQSYV
jgi:CDP-glycerol glycerophosphotransferase